MVGPSRRTALTVTAAAVATAALPPVPATTSPIERRVRAILVGNVEKAAAGLAEAVERGEREELLSGWYGYGLHLHRGELRLFDRGEGSWREVYRLPMVPGAFASAVG